MRVLVDLLFFSGTRGGTETYVREVYSRLHDSDIEFVGFASSELAATDTSWFPGTMIDSRISAANRATWAIGEVLAVRRAARRSGADLIHSPANVGPTGGSVPVILTIHDVLPFSHPEWVPSQRFGGLLRWMIRSAARNAVRVLTISDASRADIERVFDIPSSRIDMIPLAGASRARRLGTTRKAAMLFAPSNRMPHKNQATLVRALALISASDRPRLVITGGRDRDPLVPIVEDCGVSDWVTIERWLSPERLERYYESATAVVFPTRFEGFGLPVLEAMDRGCPVICSDLPVLREVAGDAAIYVDPDAAQGFASAITNLLSNEPLRARMSMLGRERASSYSWDRTATSTLAAIRSALQ